MKITIFGNPGTGTSTIGKLLASKLNYEFKSSGNMFRDMAADLGLSIYELDTLAQESPKYDVALDNKVAEYGKAHDNFIFESRLAWHFIPDSIKIHLIADEKEAARRVAQRDNISAEEAQKNNALRIATYIERYPKYYPEISYPPADSEFDLIIDVTSIPPEEVVNQITAFLESEKNK